MTSPERPGPEANSSEIAEWMEVDFASAIAEGLQRLDQDDESDIIEVEIINTHQNEVVGTIDTNGNLKTDSEALQEVSRKYLDQGIPVLVPRTYENNEGETPHAEVEIIVKPGTRGYVRAFVDAVPSPFDCRPGEIDDLPVCDIE